MHTRHEIPLEEFAREFHRAVIDFRHRFAFFLGAGCSRSSKIPLAGELVRDRWLPDLMRIKTGRNGDSDAWAATAFPGYTRKNAAQFYGPVIGQLFRNAELRQQEIDRIVSGKEPGFGYGALAKLMTHEQAGRCCNVVLTTNFDDLVADSLYLYGNARPLVIGHEALIGFVRVTRNAPLVVKLHGDHQLAPKNTSLETEKLEESVEAALRSLLAESGLVFVGYAGGDASITRALSNLPASSLPCGVYWVNDTWPDGELGAWLNSRNATWVRHLDFDRLMLMLHVQFDLPNPDDTRFRRLLEEHKQTFETLYRDIFSTDAPEATPLKQAAEAAARKFSSSIAALMDAYSHEKDSPNEACSIYQEALRQFPKDADLHGQFARFLKKLGRFEEAEFNYEWALDADPKHAYNLGNFASFLTDVRKDHDRAEKLYRQALDADPKHAGILGSYALFLTSIRKDHDRAEKLYRQALDADSKEVNNFGNFSGMLLALGRKDEGTQMLIRCESEASDPALILECQFYRLCHLAADEEQPVILGAIRSAIDSGVRSPDFDLSGNVARAINDGHPWPGLLEVLAKVIAGKADASKLDDFPEWLEATDGRVSFSPRRDDAPMG